MECKKIKAAIDIMSSCDILSITEYDKKMIVHVFSDIIQTLQENGITIATEISAQYAILKISTWHSGYFCAVTRQLCHLIETILRPYLLILDGE